MAPANEQSPAGRRLALILANGKYQNPDLEDLQSPQVDAKQLERVLGDPKIAGFTVTSLVDGSAHAMRNTLLEFTDEAKPRDVLLVYLSCHGLLDKWQRLYFAGTDTIKNSPRGASLDALFLHDELERCRARQQILILDSCFSGAFAQGAKGASDLGLAHRFSSEARGRVVLTSSSKTELSYEGTQTGDGRRGASTYTAALVEGLSTGLADDDGDGFISPEDAHRFAVGKLRDAGAPQTPTLWIHEGQGSIALARTKPKVRRRSEPPAPQPRRQSRHVPAPSPLAELAGLLAAGDLQGADRLTTRILLDSVRPATSGPGAAAPRFLAPTRRSELSDVLLRKIDDVWDRHSGGRHGFSAQLRLYPGPPSGTPAGGTGDFQALCWALGWQPGETTLPAPEDPGEGFYPTLTGAPEDGDQNWTEDWQFTVMAVHRRIREADHLR